MNNLGLASKSIECHFPKWSMRVRKPYPESTGYTLELFLAQGRIARKPNFSAIGFFQVSGC